jgi:hypothetical protein
VRRGVTEMSFGCLPAPREGMTVSNHALITVSDALRRTRNQRGTRWRRLSVGGIRDGPSYGHHRPESAELVDGGWWLCVSAPERPQPGWS